MASGAETPDDGHQLLLAQRVNEWGWAGDPGERGGQKYPDPPRLGSDYQARRVEVHRGHLFCVDYSPVPESMGLDHRESSR